MGLQQDFQTREKIFSGRLNGLKKLTLRFPRVPPEGDGGREVAGGRGQRAAQQQRAWAQRSRAARPRKPKQRGPRTTPLAGLLPMASPCQRVARLHRQGPGTAPDGPASRAWPRSTLGASAGTAARKGPGRGGYGGWLLFFSSVPHRPGTAPQTAHGTAQREQPPSLGRNFTAASMGTLGGAAPTGAGGLQAPGPIMGPLI